MDRIEIEGGTPLSGRIQIAGAKNACLAMLPAALLTDAELRLHNVPDLADVASMTALLEGLGAEIDRDRKNGRMAVRIGRVRNHRADYDIVRKMRASFLVLGPLLAREGRAEVSLPGGCAIGERLVDQHLAALSALGAEIDLVGGYVRASAPRGLSGGRIPLAMASVGATENALMAATLARGETVVENAACEPEITALADLLEAMGARIEGAGSPVIRIQGGTPLSGAEQTVIPDRIEFGTYLAAVAITGGTVILEGARLEHALAVTAYLEATGLRIEAVEGGLRVTRPDSVQPVSVRTEPYPGFPTDLQAQIMALLSIARGESVIEETVFEHRFMHIPELVRMGADIEIRGRHARVRGVPALKGAPVMASDLRASMGLVLAGLAAQGRTVVGRVYHLDRGYECPVEKLAACNAQIRRIVD